MAATFALTFSTATLAVRAIVLRARAGGNARAAKTAKGLVCILTSVAPAGFAVAAAHSLVPWAALIASAPGLLTALWLALYPPPATRLRRIGWTLVAAFIAATAILVGGLRLDR